MSETQARLLNYVANQPEVLRGIAPGFEEIDLSAFFDNPANQMFGNEHGVAIFAHLGDGIYEGHYLFTSTATPQEIVRCCKTAFRELFTKHGAHAINGPTPRGNFMARAMNRALGFVPAGPCVDTARRDCIKYILERDKWVP